MSIIPLVIRYQRSSSLLQKETRHLTCCFMFCRYFTMPDIKFNPQSVTTEALELSTEGHVHLWEGHEVHGVHRSTTTEGPHHLWSIGAHEISAVALVGVTVISIMFIAAIYYTYKYCFCCRRCRKDDEISDVPPGKVSDPEDIDNIFMSRSDWDKPKESDIKPIPSRGSISSFLDV